MTRTRILAWSTSVLVAAGATGAGAEPRPLGRDSRAYEAPDPRPALISPVGDLTLRDALSLALLHNPGLAADSWEVRAREAEMIQVGRRPNPELAVEVENLAGSGPFRGLRGVETTLALSQVLELGGKRAKRIEEARLDRDLAAWDYEARRVDVLSGTVVAFVEVLAAQERVALADTLVGVAEDVLSSVSRRVKAGGVSPVEQRRARVSLETSRIDRDRTVRALGVARARLSAAWGGSAPIFDIAVGRLELSADRELPSFEELAGRADQSPEVARWSTELDRRRASRELAESIGVPNLTVGGGIRHFNEDDEAAFVAGVSVPLPLFDRNRETAAAAESRTRSAEEGRRATEARIHLALATAHASLLSASHEAAALRERILPEAESALVESREAYGRGRLRLTDVLDAQRSAFELRVRYVDVLATHHVVVAEIERLLGMPLHEETTSRGDR